MNWFYQLVTNPFLVTSLSSWFIAQVLKVIINFIVLKKWDFTRLVGDGGMPSGHSATVTSLAVITALICGTASFEFAASAILAVIVCHDARGVRQETGKQSIIINEIIEAFSALSSKELPDVKLKEFVGHTPIQVAVGIAIGILNALIMYYWVFRL